MGNSSDFISKQIRDRIESGKIYFNSDFEDLGNQEVIKKTLYRLEKSHFLIRLYKGIYLRAEKDKLTGIVYPSLEMIAERIAEHDRVSIIPVGSSALNSLGLSMQVPMNAVYITNGSSKKMKVGKRKLIFRNVTQKNFMFKSKTLSLIVLAFKEIGKEGVTNEMIEKINVIISNEGKFDLYKEDMLLIPIWIKEILKPIISNN